MRQPSATLVLSAARRVTATAAAALAVPRALVAPAVRRAAGDSGRSSES